MIHTVAVIGGSGFVGRTTIEKLAQAGNQIIVLCRNSDRAKYLKPMGRSGQITIVAGNALDNRALEAVLAPADAVVNMVGILAESGAQKFDAAKVAAAASAGEDIQYEMQGWMYKRSKLAWKRRYFVRESEMQFNYYAGYKTKIRGQIDLTQITAAKAAPTFYCPPGYEVFKLIGTERTWTLACERDCKQNILQSKLACHG